MFFIHEIDLTQRIYREIITCDPYIALFHAGRSYVNDRYKVLVRSTDNFYDIFEQKERDLTFVFYHVKHKVKACVLVKKKFGVDENPYAAFADLVSKCCPPAQKTYMTANARNGLSCQDTVIYFYTNTSEKPMKDRYGFARFYAFPGFDCAVMALGAHSPFSTPAEFVVNLSEVKKNEFHFNDLKRFTERYTR